MNTRKYPRTLNEAFGPYTSREFAEPKDTGYGWAWWSAMVVVAVVSVVIVGVTS